MVHAAWRRKRSSEGSETQEIVEGLRTGGLDGI